MSQYLQCLSHHYFQCFKPKDVPITLAEFYMFIISCIVVSSVSTFSWIDITFIVYHVQHLKELCHEIQPN